MLVLRPRCCRASRKLAAFSDELRNPPTSTSTPTSSSGLADDTRTTHHIHHGTSLPRGRLLPGYDPQVCLPSYPVFPARLIPAPFPSSRSPTSQPPQLTYLDKKRPLLPRRRLQAPRHNPHNPPRRKLPQLPARPHPAPRRPHPGPRTLRIHPPHQPPPGPLIPRRGQDQGLLHHQAGGREEGVRGCRGGD